MKKFVTMLFALAGFGLPLTVVSSSVAWAQAQKSAQGSHPSDQSMTKLQPLNIKPGLWESTRTIKRNGEPSIPAELLNRLTPEQRARMEERMKANSAGHTSTATEKHCVTKEDLEKDRLKIAEAEQCTTTVLNSTSTNVRGKMVCDTGGIHATGTLELVAVDPEHVNGTFHSTMDGDGHTMNVESTWTSKWLGSSCGDAR